MRQVRRNIFETNSSSVHTLTLSADNSDITPEWAHISEDDVDKDGVLLIKPLAFCQEGDGGAVERIYTCKGKLAYYIAARCDGYCSEVKFHQIVQEVKTIFPWVKNIVMGDPDNVDEYGWTDYDDVTVGITLEEFLTQPYMVLGVDNCYPELIGL